MSSNQIPEEYFHLTGVNIGAEKQIWDERGKGYYGEYLVFARLYSTLPGFCKFLMNLQVPTQNGKTTEIDLLMIHETGIYVFEIKHFKGVIYGKAEDLTWTQYFKTDANYKFKNPILQNDYHVAAIQNVLLQNQLTIGTPNINSAIVFTNDQVTLRIENARTDVTVSMISELIPDLHKLINSKLCLSADQVDTIWRIFAQYAPLQQSDSNSNISPISVYEYLDELKKSLVIAKDQLEITKKQVVAEYNRKTKAARKKVRRWARWFVVGFLLVSLGACTYCVSREARYIAEAESRIALAETELNTFKQKWYPVKDFRIDETMIKTDFVLVKDLVLENVPDLANVVKLSCVLEYNGEDYYAVFDKNSKYIILLKDGTVYEFDVFDSPYYAKSLGDSASTLAVPITDELFGEFRIDEINLIKIANVTIRKKNVYYNNTIATNFEIELYADNSHDFTSLGF